MSGKFEKKKAKKKVRGQWILLILAIGLAIAVMLVMNRGSQSQENIQEENQETSAQTQGETAEAATQPEQRGISLGNGLEILNVGSYTGTYMEDGTDELVTGVLMMKVVNHGKDAVEYAKITMAIGDQTGEFVLTTLTPGSEVVLLEKKRMACDKAVDYTAAKFSCENFAVYQEPLRLHEDKLHVQILDGAINVTNISGADISGRIAIYYKNKAAGIYYGGITYRIILEEGLKAGAIRQMMASHFSDTGSEIVFITVAQ